MTRRILSLFAIALAITFPMHGAEKVVQFGFSAPGGGGLKGPLEQQLRERLLTGAALSLADGDGATVDARGFRFLTIITDPDRATGVLTPTGNPADAETVTIGSTVYTFEDGTLNVAFEVALGADLATTLTNLNAAINASGTAGTEYATGTTVHPTVSSTTSATALTVAALTAGSGANTIATTDTITGGWPGATLVDVVDPIVTWSVAINPNATSHAYTTGAATLAGTVTGTVPTRYSIDVAALHYRITTSLRSIIELVP